MYWTKRIVIGVWIFSPFVIAGYLSNQFLILVFTITMSLLFWLTVVVVEIALRNER